LHSLSCLFQRRATLLLVRLESENVPHSQLNLPRRVGLVCIGGTDSTKTGRVKEDLGQVESRVIEEVEELEAQLEMVAFAAWRDHFAEGKVDVRQAGQSRHSVLQCQSAEWRAQQKRRD
jgi:hypothetical protein